MFYFKKSKSCNLFDDKLTNIELGIFLPDSSVLQHMLLTVVNHCQSREDLTLSKFCLIGKTQSFAKFKCQHQLLFLL